MELKLKEIRKNNKLSQNTVAEFLNISTQNYCRYELGQVKISLEDTIKLADYYNVSLDYLCGRRFNNNIGYIPDNKRPAINTLLELDENQFKIIEDYINYIAQNKTKK